MKTTVEIFKKRYSEAIIRDEAAIFAGAGVSKSVGYCDWKELLSELAKDINLNVELEYDYLSLAQYYENNHNHQILCNIVLDTFAKIKNDSTLVNALCDLPIKTYWTTNYDHNLEDTLKNKYNKLVDVKKSNFNLSSNLRDRDATVYKFHGDIDDLSSIVLTRRDYEEFENKNIPFINNLNGDLISKTFVFVGYSFNDPDLLNILKNIKYIHNGYNRIHYALLKKVDYNDYSNIEAFNYAKIKREYVTQDLMRYGIVVVEVDDFKDIPQIFHDIKRKCILNNIYIAGSSRQLPDNWPEQTANQFLFTLGYRLAKEGFKVCTGYNEGVGPQIENGVLNAVSECNLNLNKSLNIKRLPLINGSLKHMSSESKNAMRHDIYNNNGIMITLFGNNFYDNVLKPSQGVLNDYKRAKKAGMYIIPVASTGGASKIIFDEISKNLSEYQYLHQHFDALTNELNPNLLCDTIFQIIAEIKNL